MRLRAVVALAILSGAPSAFAADPPESATDAPTKTVTTTTTTTTTQTTELKCDTGTTCEDATPDYNTVFGVRGSFLHVSGPQDVTTGGATFALNSENYKTIGLFSLRSSAIAGLGGGNGGVEGSLGAGFTGGIRIPVADNHGPIARVGLSMELLGNSQFYYSHIDLPLGEVGYQYSKDDTMFEIGARGAPLLTGRYNTGDTFRRELGTSFEWGGYLGAHGKIGRLDASFTRIEARNTPPDTPVDVLRGDACLYATKLVAICADAMYIHGDEQPPAVIVPATPSAAVSFPAANSFYGGLLVGVRW